MAVDINITPIIREVTILVGTNAGAAVWGGITGTLSNQTDLAIQQTAQDDAIALNTAKDGITAQQASDITTNNAKISYTDSAAVALNTAKVTFPEAPNDGTQYARKNLGWEAVAGGTSPILTAYKTADETIINSATVILDSELQFELEANSFYSVLIYTPFEADIAYDYRILFQVPTGASGFFYYIDQSSIKAHYTMPTLRSIGGGGAGVTRGFTARCTVQTTNAGTFGLQWAQNSPGPVGTTIYKGAAMVATKLN